MADVSVRPARPADAERVARAQLGTWRTAYAHLLPREALDLPEEQAATLWLHAVESPASPRHRVLVAMERDELVGFLASAPPQDEDDLDADGAVEVTALVVEPRWGRRGHGSRLLAAAVDGWRGDGVRTAVAWVWEGDPATRSFLASAGWAPDGRARGLDTGSPGTGSLVHRQLRHHVDVGPGG